VALESAHPAEHACGRHVNYFFRADFFEAFFFFEALAAFLFLAMSVTSFLGINTTRRLESVKRFFVRNATLKAVGTSHLDGQAIEIGSTHVRDNSWHER
jgi:hypothetical protein